MKSFIAFFRLIRLPNLLIIALTQYAVRFGLMFPLLGGSGFELAMSEQNFFLLVLATVMIAAAGYIINDYFDTKIDRVNKPKRVIVGKLIKRRVAMGAHIVISAIAIFISIYIAWYINHLWLSLIQIGSVMALWYYSINFKRRMLVGNVIIALLTALVPVSAGLYEFVELKNHIFEEIQNYAVVNSDENPIYAAVFFKDVLTNIGLWIIGYAIFAFLLTMVREIIKDIEDYEGDLAEGCKTLPIVMGKNKANHTTIIIAVITFLLLLFVQYTQLMSSQIVSVLYFSVFLQFPLIMLIVKLISAKKKNDYAWASRLTKLIMLFGILYTSVIYFQEFYLNV
tara:strand:+ start:1306 stop:2322 length:1017 start_codon:yes stop_codon:yes gene_type:complete